MRQGLLALALAAAAALDPVAFPGAAEARDPTGRYTVLDATSVGASGNEAHALILKNLKTGASQPLQMYGRSAMVLWAPEGNALAITDRAGRDSSTVKIFVLQRFATPVDVGAELSRSFPSMPERTGNRYVRLEAVRWLDARTLRFRLRGYGDRDPGGFDLLFDYTLGADVRRARSV